MSRQRDIPRGWRPWMQRRRAPAAAQSMLDSISLTAVMTDPTPRTPPSEVHPRDLLGDLSGPVPLAHRAPEADVADEFWTDRLRDRWASFARRLGTASWRRVPRRNVLAGGAGVVLLCIGLLAAGVIGQTSATPPPATHVPSGPLSSRLVVHTTHLHLAPATTAAAPALPLVAQARTASHEVFGYAPYWSLPQASSFPVEDFSTLAYFSVDINANGSIDQSGSGWDGYQSQDLVDLVTRAHQAGDRVVLTATDFSQSSLDALTHDPNAGIVLGNSLLELVQTKGLDGVNLDLEGAGSADQAGLNRIAADVNLILHVADPHYQFTMATYASSAGDANGFYDIPTLSQYVDAFFVMAYDVSQGAGGSGGGYSQSDAAYIGQYLAKVPSSKVILGVPLFGYDEPTVGPDLGDPPTGGATTVTYAQAMSSGPTYWDPSSETAWTAYQSGGHWHQVFFDNANTLALKEQLASTSNLLGVGVWALGMEGSDESVLSVLDGGSPPLRVPPVGPTASGASLTNGSGSGSGSGSTSGSGSGGGRHHGGGGSSGAANSNTTTTTGVKSTTTTTRGSGTTTSTSTTTSSTTTTTTAGSNTGTTGASGTTGATGGA